MHNPEVDDLLVKELLGYSYLFTGKKEEGEALLTEIADHIPEETAVKPGLQVIT